MFLILKKKRKCPSGLEIPGVGFLFPPFLPTPSPVEATPGRAPVLGGGGGVQGNHANLLFSFTLDGTTQETFIFPDVDYS